MLAIIPIYFEESEFIWNSDSGYDVLDSFVVNIHNVCEFDRVIVCTDNEAVIQMLENRNIDIRRITLKKHSDAEILFPRGTRAVVTDLKSEIVDDQDVAIINFRNPLLTFKTIEDSIKMFKNSESSGLVSIKPSEDHPCQFRMYNHVIDYGIIHIFEETTMNLPRRIGGGKVCDVESGIYYYSKPFFFDWAERGIFSKHETGLYVMAQDRIDVNYYPVDANDIEYSNCSLGYLWEYLDGFSARLLFEKQLIDSKASSVLTETDRLFGAGSHFCDKTIVLVGNDERYRILFEEVDDNPDKRLTCVPFNETGKTVSDWIDVPMVDNSCQISNPYRFKDFCGLIFGLLKSVTDDVAHISVPFMPDNGMWYFDESKNQSFSSMTGRAITGRHDFPEVWEPDGSLFMFKGADVGAFERRLLSGHALGFPIDWEQQIHIRNVTDWIRYELKRERACGNGDVS